MGIFFTNIFDVIEHYVILVYLLCLPSIRLQGKKVSETLYNCCLQAFKSVKSVDLRVYKIVKEVLSHKQSITIISEY